MFLSACQGQHRLAADFEAVVDASAGIAAQAAVSPVNESNAAAVQSPASGSLPTPDEVCTVLSQT